MLDSVISCIGVREPKKKRLEPGMGGESGGGGSSCAIDVVDDDDDDAVVEGVAGGRGAGRGDANDMGNAASGVCLYFE